MKANKLFLSALTIVVSTGNIFSQIEKFVVVEEKTGTWCGWCPYGTVAMANLEDSEPNFIGIAVHNSDPMANSYYDSQTASLPDFGGYPYACADRVVGDHAYYAPDSFNARETESPKASISVTGIVDGSTMEITVTAEFGEAVSGDWRLAAVVTEDNVTGTTSGYAQANYFAGGGSGTLSGAGHDWHTSSNPVPAASMEYDHVARLVAGNQYNGASGSLPATIEAGTTHSYTYTVNINPLWNVSNMHVIGMLIEPSGAINNAGKSSAGYLAIEEIEEKNFSISAYPNPASEMINLSIVLENTTNVKIEMVNLVGAVVSTIDPQNLAAGTYYNEIDLSQLTKGVYFIKTTLNETIEMTKIVVQ